MGRGTAKARDILLAGKPRLGGVSESSSTKEEPEPEVFQKDSPLSDPMADIQRLSKKFRPQIIDMIRNQPDRNWYPKNVSSEIARIARLTETGNYTGQTFWTIIMTMIDEGELISDEEFNISLP